MSKLQKKAQAFIGQLVGQVVGDDELIREGQALQRSTEEEHHDGNHPAPTRTKAGSEPSNFRTPNRSTTERT